MIPSKEKVLPLVMPQSLSPFEASAMQRDADLVVLERDYVPKAKVQALAEVGFKALNLLLGTPLHGAAGDRAIGAAKDCPELFRAILEQLAEEKP